MQKLINRIRHLLIPNLETYNPKFREAVWRTAQSLQADQEILTQSVDAAWTRTVVSESAGLVAFDISALMGFSVGLQRYLFRRALERIQPSGDVTYAALERMTNFLADDKQNGFLTLSGGLRLLRESGQIYVAGADATLPFERWPQLPSNVDFVPVPIPSQFELPGGWRFTCELWNIPALAREPGRQARRIPRGGFRRLHPPGHRGRQARGHAPERPLAVPLRGRTRPLPHPRPGAGEKRQAGC